MTALIFGINSQDGFYLKKKLQLLNIEIVGVSRSKGEWLEGSVTNKDFVDSLIKSLRPQYIFHIAAVSTTIHDVLLENHEIISTGSLNILESVLRNSPESKVFLTGSGLQFVNTGVPIDEMTCFDPNSAYSISRIHSVYTARYFRTLGIRVYVGYLFHHESYLRKDHHVSKKISEAVARISNGSNEKLLIGDPSVQKEWTFAGDVINGIMCLVSQETIYEACIGSGVTYSILDWIKACFSVVNLDWEEFLNKKEGFNPEYRTLLSNPNLIKSFGWNPTTSINDLAFKMVSKQV